MTDHSTRKRPDTALAWHLRRMGLKLVDLQRISGEPYATCRNWHTGRNRTPRSIIRLLAAWRLLHWRGPNTGYHRHHPAPADH